MKISSWLKDDYVPADGEQITLTVGNVINPASTKPVSGLQITFLALGKYAIDDFVGDTPWVLAPGLF
jgi:hypothetical protein